MDFSGRAKKLLRLSLRALQWTMVALADLSQDVSAGLYDFQTTEHIICVFGAKQTWQRPTAGHNVLQLPLEMCAQCNRRVPPS